MAWEKVDKAPTPQELSRMKRQYRKLTDKYDKLKEEFTYHVCCEDFDMISNGDFFEVKELYLETRRLYWDIYKLEHPEDKATVAAYEFLNSLSFDDKVDFLQEHHLTTHMLIEKLNENPNYIKEVTA